MTELTTYQPPAEQTGTDLHRPDLQQWAQNLQAAHQIGSALCGTSFAPAHFRGKPDEAAAAILYGSEVGFTPTQALQNLYVIGGKPALYARPMVAIVQAAGHEVWTESKTDEAVIVCGRRRGTENVIREEWTYARAQKAGYTSNKKYQTDPQAMLYARAASDVCRQIAADALAGMVYSVEELELSDRPASATVKSPGVAGLRAAVQGQTNTPADNGTASSDPIEDAYAENFEQEMNALPIADAETGEAITPAQSKALHAAFGDIGLTDRDKRLEYASRIVGRELASSNDLTKREASVVIDSAKADAEAGA